MFSYNTNKILIKLESVYHIEITKNTSNSYLYLKSKNYNFSIQIPNNIKKLEKISYDIIMNSVVIKEWDYIRNEYNEYNMKKKIVEKLLSIIENQIKDNTTNKFNL